MDEVFAIGEMEMESGLSGAILRHANFFACEKLNFDFFGGNSGFCWRIIFLCPPPCGTANAVWGKGTTGGEFWEFFHKPANSTMTSLELNLRQDPKLQAKQQIPRPIGM